MLLNLGGLESPKPERQVGRAARAQTDLTTPAVHHGVGFENYVANLGHEVVRLLFRTIRDRSTEEAVGPLLCEPARASEDDWHLTVANGKPAEHIGQPGSTSCLGSEEIGVITFDHDCRSCHLR